MSDQQSSGLSAKVRDLWAQNNDLLRNAGSLAATTGLTSLFGFVFWIVADREFSKPEAGYAIAATNAMQHAAPAARSAWPAAERPHRALRDRLGRGGFRWEHAERGDPDLADRRVPPAALRSRRAAEGGSRNFHVA
jgi:hypothetical protein